MKTEITAETIVNLANFFAMLALSGDTPIERAARLRLREKISQQQAQHTEGRGLGEPGKGS